MENTEIVATLIRSGLTYMFTFAIIVLGFKMDAFNKQTPKSLMIFILFIMGGSVVGMIVHIYALIWLV